MRESVLREREREVVARAHGVVVRAHVDANRRIGGPARDRRDQRLQRLDQRGGTVARRSGRLRQLRSATGISIDGDAVHEAVSPARANTSTSARTSNCLFVGKMVVMLTRTSLPLHAQNTGTARVRSCARDATASASSPHTRSPPRPRHHRAREAPAPHRRLVGDDAHVPPRPTPPATRDATRSARSRHASILRSPRRARGPRRHVGSRTGTRAALPAARRRPLYQRAPRVATGFA